MSDHKNKIIDLIQRNRISSTEVADALGKTGVVSGPKCISKGKFIVGEIDYIYGFSESNWAIHKQGEHVQEGKVLFVDEFECNDKALFGDIVAKYFMLYRRMKGIVANGLLRDVHVLIKEDYPIWCNGFTPLGCNNKEVHLTDDLRTRSEERKALLHGSVIVCDDSGCTVIGKDFLNADTLRRLEFTELQEDIWYYCLDTLKWTTYETICQKRYLTESNVLPAYLQERLNEFSG